MRDENYWAAWKGAAMLAVIGIHAGNVFASAPFGGFDERAGLALRQAMNFCVALFFFLSAWFGAQSSCARRPYAARVLRRFRILLGPYLFWAAIYALAHLAAGDLEWRALPRQLLTGEAVAVGYFVIVLLQYTLLAPWLERWSTRALWAGLALSGAASLTFTYHVEGGASFWSTFPGFALPGFVWGPFLFAGLLVGRPEVETWLRQRVSVRTLACLCGLGLGLSLAEAFRLPPELRTLGVSQVKLSSMLTSLLICLLALRITLGPGFRARETIARTQAPARFLSWIGRRSYTVYLSHMLFMAIVARAANRIFAPAEIASLWGFAVYFAATLGLCCALLRGCDLIARVRPVASRLGLRT